MPRDDASIHVLHVDDEAEIADLTETFLERVSDDVEVTTATSVDRALDRLDASPVDCVVSDFDMPEMDGIAFLRRVRERHPDLPFILFTGKGSEEIASEAISAGVTDYLQKRTGESQYTMLANRIRNAVAVTRSRSEAARRKRRLETLIENLPGMVYRCRNERNWPMLSVEGDCQEITGHPAHRLVSGDVEYGTDVIHPEHQREVREVVQGGVETDDSFEMGYRILTADEEVRWVWESGRVIRDDDGKPTELEGFITDVTERREDRERLQFFAELVEHLGVGVAAYDETGSFSYVNEAYAALLETNADRLSSASVWEVVPEMDAESFRTRWNGFEDDETRVEETEHAHESDAVPVRTVTTRRVIDGTSYHFLTVTDISDRIAHERELERATERLELALSASNFGVYDWHVADDEIRFDERVADILGIPFDEIEHELSFWTDRTHPDDLERVHDDLQPLYDGEIAFNENEYRVEAADGSLRWVHSIGRTVEWTSDGEPKRVIGVHQDVTERKEREQELERYEELTETVADPIYFLDETGDIEMVNRAFAELTGADRAELPGGRLREFIDDADADRAKERVIELIEHGSRDWDTMEMRIHPRDGEDRIAENKFSIVMDGDTFVGTVGVIRDITERKRHERLLEEFAGVVSHDLRNPLNVATGRLALAEEDGASDHLIHAREALERMEQLIEDLLEVARTGNTVRETEHVPITRLARTTWDGMATGDASLAVQDDAVIRADPGRVRQLLENVFRNAIEHAGEPVRIEVGSWEDGWYVADDGSGIPPDQRDEVFRMGHSAGEGAGLGLAIVDRIARGHGWQPRMTDGPSGGARVEFAEVDVIDR